MFAAWPERAPRKMKSTAIKRATQVCIVATGVASYGGLEAHAQQDAKMCCALSLENGSAEAACQWDKCPTVNDPEPIIEWIYAKSRTGYATIKIDDFFARCVRYVRVPRSATNDLHRRSRLAGL
jgi:hypothetical protein